MKRKKEGDAIRLLLTFDKEIKLNKDQIKKPLEVQLQRFLIHTYTQTILFLPTTKAAVYRHCR